jgi:zinc/manganese transport system substrate-binding protein
MSKKYGALTTLVLLALVSGSFAACGSDDDESSGPTISATTGIWADVTEQVAGDDADVEQLIPDASSPHDFQLSAQDRAKIEDSVLLVYNGADLEAGIPIDDIDVDKFAAADHVGPLERFQPAGSREHPTPEEEEQGGVDPHVWMDPSRIAAALPALADDLAKADPDHADGYRERAQAYAEELMTLDGEIEQSLAALPPSERRLVTSHDALGYFADRYGFEVLATPFPASGPEAEASAQTITEVENAVKSSGVKAVFAEETDDPEVLRQIGEDTGVEVEEDLLVESPGDAPSYIEMLRRDAELISAALAGNGTGLGSVRNRSKRGNGRDRG